MCVSLWWLSAASVRVCTDLWKNVNLGCSPWFKISGKHWARRLEIHLWGFILQKENSVELPVRQSFEWKNVQCRTEREQVGYETLIEITAERNKPEWILIASWWGSFCLCTYRCFPLHLCKTNACTMLNGKKYKQTNKKTNNTNNKTNNLYKGDEKLTKAMGRAVCYKCPSLKTKAEPSFCGMYWRVFCCRTEILLQEEYCNIWNILYCPWNAC